MSVEYVVLEHGCWQRIDHSRTVTTGFGDGGELRAAPVMDEESVARARSLGYRGSDEAVVWAMTCDHDRIHMELAQAEGSQWRRVLHGVVTGEHACSDEAHREECRVFYVQRKVNEARWPRGK